MKIVAVIAQKGGVGKTTTAIEFAVAAHLAGVQTTLEMAELAKKPAHVLINAVPTNRQHLGVKALAGLQDRRISVAPVIWMERAAFADLAADDLAAPERDPTSKAAQEVSALLEWLCGKLGLTESLLGGKTSTLLAGKVA